MSAGKVTHRDSMPVMSPRVTCHRYMYRNPDASHVHYSPSPLPPPKPGACPPIPHPDAYLLPYPSTSTRVGRRCFETRSRTIDRVLLSWDACTCQLGCIGGSWPCVAAIGGVRDIATVLAWLAAGGRRQAGRHARENRWRNEEEWAKEVEGFECLSGGTLGEGRQ